MSIGVPFSVYNVSKDTRLTFVLTCDWGTI